MYWILGLAGYREELVFNPVSSNPANHDIYLYLAVVVWKSVKYQLGGYLWLMKR
jgi:hypothetical protein